MKIRQPDDPRLDKRISDPFLIQRIFWDILDDLWFLENRYEQNKSVFGSIEFGFFIRPTSRSDVLLQDRLHVGFLPLLFKIYAVLFSFGCLTVSFTNRMRSFLCLQNVFLNIADELCIERIFKTF